MNVHSSSGARRRRQGSGPIARLSRILGYLRFAFMPLGLFAVIAVGVHAAADTLDDRLLWVVDQADAWVDGWLGRWSVTEGAIGWIDLQHRVTIARSLTLVWELTVDALLALPALGYRERQGRAVTGATAWLGTPARRWRDMLRDVIRRPTLLRVTRPLATAAVVLAGACAVARMVQGAVYLSFRGGLTEEVAGLIARLSAIGVLGGVLVAFGVRAVLRNLQHADQIALEHPDEGWFRAAARGLPGTALVIPLAVAALLYASPVLSFFR
jgi:hypothetical protein